MATLVGVPVMGATFVDVLYRSTELTPGQRAEGAIGTADAALVVYDAAPLEEDFSPSPYFGYGAAAEGATERDASTVDPTALLPAGSTVLAAPQQGDIRLERSSDRTVRTEVQVADLREATLQSMVRLRTGSFPTGADDVVLTEVLADRLGLLEDGDLVDDASITVKDGASADVVGVVVQPRCLDCPAAYVTPDSVIGRSVDADQDLYSTVAIAGGAPTYLVDLPAGTDADALWRDLTSEGVGLYPRDAWLHLERYESGSQASVTVGYLQAVAIVALIVGLGLLEVVLLAGTAFAVGARRQVRDLGLVAVTGGTARDVRRVVLAQGLVLGALGAVGGIVLGSLVAVALKPLWERLGGELLETWRFGPLEILLAAGVGLFSGLAAAFLPALGASRINPVDALHRRFRVRRGTTVGVPVVGLGLVLGGGALSLYGSQLMADDFAAYKTALESVQQTGEYITAPTPVGPVSVILVGLVIAVAGVVAAMPTLVALLGGLGGRLSLSPRLALRDASRHRHRTGPATTAIAIAVAGSVGIGVLVHNLETGERLSHVPSLPSNVMQVQADDAGDLAAMQQAVRAGEDLIRRAVPGSSVVEARVPLLPASQTSSQAQVPTAEQYYTRLASLEWSDGSDCVGGTCNGYNSGQVGLRVGGPDLLGLVLGRDPTSDEVAALEGGEVVVTSPNLLRDGAAHLQDPSGDPEVQREATALPALVAERSQAFSLLPSAVMSESTALSLGLELVRGEGLVRVPALPTGDDRDRLLETAEEQGAYVSYEEPFRSDYWLAQLILLAAGAFVTFVGVAIAVALSAAESRADFATLAAVGAQPSRRRRLSAAQALLVGGLGCLVGLGLGMFAAYVARAATGAPTFTVPWDTVLATGVAVPLLATVVAWVVTPGRLPMIRRIE